MESINPVDNPVGMPPNSTKAQDSQPERREDSKHRVEVSGQRTNRFVWVDGSILAADRLGDGSLREPDGG